MKAFLLGYLLLISCHLNAATWYVTNVHDNSVLASFDHIEGGYEPLPGSGFPPVYFENIQFSIGGSFFSGIFTRNDDSHLVAASHDNPEYAHLEMFFSEPLTALGGTVGMSFMALAWDGNWCSQGGVCLNWNAEDYVATTLPPVPLPAAAWFFLSAIGGLGILKRAKKRLVHFLRCHASNPSRTQPAWQQFSSLSFALAGLFYV